MRLRPSDTSLVKRCTLAHPSAPSHYELCQRGERRWPQELSSLRPAVVVNMPAAAGVAAAAPGARGAAAAPPVGAGEGDGLVARQACTEMHSCWAGS